MTAGMSVEVGEAREDEIPRLCELLAELFAREAEFRPDPERQAAGLRRIIDRPEVGRILVLRPAGGAGEAIGMVNLLFTVSTALGAPVALLEDLVIAPDHRGGGHGSRLLTAALEHAEAAGCARVTLLTDHDNEAAQRFYRRHGFESSVMLPMRRLI